MVVAFQTHSERHCLRESAYRCHTMAIKIFSMMRFAEVRKHTKRMYPKMEDPSTICANNGSPNKCIRNTVMYDLPNVELKDLISQQKVKRACKHIEEHANQDKQKQ
eukprot:PhF_6_TR10051/c2_g3_i5/m.15497